MSLEERHWPSLCIIALLSALSAAAVVAFCAGATPVINAVLNNAIAIYFDFIMSSIVNQSNTGCSLLVLLVGKRECFAPTTLLMDIGSCPAIYGLEATFLSTITRPMGP